MIIIDDFVEDKRLLKQIEVNKEEFFSDNGNYYWWNGWWDSPANTLKKRLIKYLWSDKSPYKPLTISGFEYWTGQFGPDKGSDYLNMHLDKDEALWKDTGEISSPIIGTVFYPIEMEIEGAEVYQGRGPRAFVAALEPLLHHFLRRVKVVQREQRRVVHGVHALVLFFFQMPSR